MGCCKMQVIKIKTEYIKLGQLLKFADVISNGGQEKEFIANHKIKVNDVDENRRGRKLYPGDEVRIDSILVKVSKDED